MNTSYAICRYNNASGKEEYIYKTRDGRYIFHSKPNIWFGSEDAAKNYIAHNRLDNSNELYVKQKETLSLLFKKGMKYNGNGSNS